MSTSEIKKTKRSCKIISQECIGKDIYSMWLNAGEIAKNAVPGQFVSLYSRDGSKLLPRPISLCEIDKEEEKLRLVSFFLARYSFTFVFPYFWEIRLTNTSVASSSPSNTVVT